MKKSQVEIWAIGNHKLGYRGKVVMVDLDGKEIVVWTCEHRHAYPAGARTCAAMRNNK